MVAKTKKATEGVTKRSPSKDSMLNQVREFFLKNKGRAIPQAELLPLVKKSWYPKKYLGRCVSYLNDRNGMKVEFSKTRTYKFTGYHK